jgi:hypothetical protein
MQIKYGSAMGDAASFIAPALLEPISKFPIAVDPL